MQWPLGYQSHPHQAKWLQDVRSHDRVLILAPADHGKTVTVAIVYVIWRLVLDRNLRVCVLSYSEDQASKDVREIRFHLESNRQLINNFPPNFMPESPERWTDTELIIRREEIAGKMKDSSIIAKGAFSGLQNLRFDLIICDDIVDPQTTATAKTRKDLREWWCDVVETRIERGGQGVLIGSRQHVLDMYSNILDNPEYRSFVYKALDPVTNRVLAPTMWSRAHLERQKRLVTPRSFAKKYNNDPRSDEHVIFSDDHLLGCKYPTIKMARNHREMERPWIPILGIDLAIGTKSNSSYFVIIAYAYNPENRRRRLLNFFRRQGISYPDQKRMVRQYNALYLPKHILVETNAYQKALIQDEDLRDLPLVGTVTTSNKYSLIDGIPHLVDLTDCGAEDDNREPLLELPYGCEESRSMTNSFAEELLGYPLGNDDMLMAWSFAERGVMEFMEEGEKPPPGVIRPTWGHRRVPVRRSPIHQRPRPGARRRNIKKRCL